MLAKGCCWWANESRYRHLLGDWDHTEEVVFEHLFQVHAFCEIDSEALADEIFGLITNMNVFGERECASANLLVSLFDFLGLKGWSTIQHGVENDTDGPVVDIVAVSTISFKHFGSQVVWSAANCSLLFALVKDLGS